MTSDLETFMYDVTGETPAAKRERVFATRNAPHETMKWWVTYFFVELGCVVESVGIELLPILYHRLLSTFHDDPTTLFLRFRPDLAVTVPSQKRTHLCEVKSELPNTKTGNIALQLTSLQECRRLEDAGLSVFFVFGNGTACRPSAVMFDRKFDNPQYLATITRGSRTAFGVFRQDAPFLRKLGQFAPEELGL